jgi:hypothetical protein
MKTKHLTLLGAAVLCLVVYLGLGGAETGPTNVIDDGLVRVAKFNVSALDQLTVSQNGTEVIRLAKKPTGWKLASGHRADAKKVADLIDDLANLKAEVRPARADQLKTYGLAEADSKTEVFVRQGEKVLAQVTLGKKGPDWGTAFTKRSDHDEVLLTREGPVGRLVSSPLKASSLLDQYPGKHEAAAVSELSIKGSFQRVLTKFQPPEEDGKPATAVWTAANKEKVDSAAVDALLTHLSSLYVRESTSPAKEQLAVELTLTGAPFKSIGYVAGDADMRTLVVDGMAYTIGKASITTLEEKLTAIKGD